jgi:hypothetical protein
MKFNILCVYREGKRTVNNLTKIGHLIKEKKIWFHDFLQHLMRNNLRGFSGLSSFEVDSLLISLFNKKQKI